MASFDIMQLLFQALRIQELAYKYTNTVDQFLYLIFFPSLIVIAIIYLFMGKVVQENAKLKFLFTIAMFVFIIVYPPNSDKSLYTALAPLGQYWFLGVAIVAVLWFFIGRHVGFGGALPGSKSGGAMGGLLRRKKTLEDIDEQLDIMAGILGSMETADSGKLADYIREFRQAYKIASDDISEIEVLPGVDIHGKDKQLKLLLKRFKEKYYRLQKQGKTTDEDVEFGKAA